ncbi:hypothetical protein L2E82_46900 [Cichorium intybus]|uniref:Uncharacterized protein n=1 Tax=Cichorium intybus TaxID=13427 RepID=A0ACB8YUA5_CICIN|nr:hypothetical protein L2E82_46900 [Cichorium intybus]
MDYLVTTMAVVAERFPVMVAVERFPAVVMTGKFPVVVEMASSEGFDFAGTEAGEIKKEHRIMALEICCCVEFTGPLVAIVGLFMNSGVTLFSLAVSVLQSLRIHISPNHLFVLDEMSERDRLILLKYLLSGTLIKKAVMPAGAVCLDDVDLHQVSVDFVLNSVKKVCGILELSEAIRDYHDSTGYPHMNMKLMEFDDRIHQENNQQPNASSSLNTIEYYLDDHSGSNAITSAQIEEVMQNGVCLCSFIALFFDVFVCSCTRIQSQKKQNKTLINQRMIDLLHLFHRII